MLAKKSQRRNKIRRRIRKKIFGTAQLPRISVFRSNKEIYAQIIDDINGHTLAAASSRDQEIEATGTKTEVSAKVGELLAKRAKKAGVEDARFDRGGYRYHGRVKALAEGARKGGLKF